ncbi:MAG: TlpA family protein disulfide reductase [Planctomycetota bacterium]
MTNARSPAIAQPAEASRARFGGLLALLFAGAFTGAVSAALFVRDGAKPRRTVVAAKRAPEQILADFRSIKIPSFQPTGMSAAEYSQLIVDACRRQGELALEMFRGHPAHSKTASLLETRWTVMINALDASEDSYRETGDLLTAGAAPRAVLDVALALRAYSALGLDSIALADKVRLVDAALAAPRPHSYCSYLLERLALDHMLEPAEQLKALRRAAELAQDDELPELKRQIAMLERVGKPFAMRFTDPRDQREVDVSALAGRYVLLHMWSFFPLCEDYMNEREAGEIVELKALRASFPQLEIITVNRWADPELVAEFVRRARPHEIPWPLFYDAYTPQPNDGVNDWRRVKSWMSRNGLGDAPRYVLLDAQGRFAAFSTRVETLRSVLASKLSPPARD